MTFNRIAVVTVAIFASASGGVAAAGQAARSRPNVLWVLTDDQRYDSIRAFNQMLHGREMSALGYVESPNVDRLARRGTTFVNTYCQAQGCAPSRASMHYGRYPFRSGIYEFEYHNNNAEHCRPTLPEEMVKLGYQTTHVGKLGVRVKTIAGSYAKRHPIYEQSFYFKDLAKDGLCGWAKSWITQINGRKFDKPFRALEYFVTPEGTFEYCSLELERLMPEFAGTCARTMQKYELLRHYNEKKGKHVDSGMILSGVSSRAEGQTRDGYYASIFEDYLRNEDRSFQVGSATYEGVDTSKPLFCHIGFDFPHTPVLPPATYRARFKKHDYAVPDFDEAELRSMPDQLKRMVRHGYSDHFTDAEKQAMTQDYYAFCAYGDSLVGQATDAFVAFSERHDRPWVIVYVCGDHGWKLNDHGSVSKFTPWDVDSHNPIIVVSSDEAAFPPGKVVTDFTEFVDIAPTILAAGGADLDDAAFEHLDGFNLADVVSGEAPRRDYVLGESHAVLGPRAFIRTKEYAFSIQTRPDRNRGENLEWALGASYEEIDPALYHMPSDPHEVTNLAHRPEYRGIATTMRDKLLSIVLGDNRVEVDWGGDRATGTRVFRSNFAPGADDKRIVLDR